MRLASLLLSVVAATASAADLEPAQRLLTEEDGVRFVRPLRDPGAWANPWPAAWEKPFRQRMAHDIALFKGKARIKTDGESEKWSYPACFGAYWAGDLAPALEGLTARDLDAADHAWTKGHDFYWCFNLKGQVTKWFLFRGDLPADYRAEFAEAARIWTASDPRPTMEYVLLLDTPDTAVRAFAAAELGKMWRDAAQLRQMADEADQEEHPNKKAFAKYLRDNADRIAEGGRPADAAAWRRWWGAITAGDWMVFEEYERRVNPNPHPAFGVGSGPVGATWNPNVRGMRADARNTDNLRAMREVAVYLFAEDAGNELIRKVYKEKLKRTAIGFWEVGNGEWDSEGYLAHAMAPYHSLYAFAKDEEVRGYAKAILDFMMTSAAMKYWRGAWGGPVKRDYGNVTPWSTAAHFSWLWFGDAPKPPHEGEDELTFTYHSGYRPPAAVVALAQKRFARPTDVWSTHPSYQNWLPGQNDAPEARETMGWGETWQMGSLARAGGGDLNGGKILVWNEQTGADFIVPGIGKAKDGTNFGTGQDNIGQHRNLQIYVSGAQDGKAPLSILHAEGIESEIVGGVVFLRGQRTWLAALPINAAWSEIGKSKGGKGGKGAGMKLAQGAGAGGAFAGFAIELGEEKTHGDYAAFKAAIAATAKLAVTAEGVSFTGASGAKIDLGFRRDGLPALTLDGKAKDWDQHKGLWRPAAGGTAPVSLGWKERVLTVEAGGHRFQGTLAADGKYTFTQTVGAE